MTQHERRLLRKLRAACELQTEADFDAYLEAVAKLRGSYDMDVLCEMLQCLRDIDAGEVQYELVEACERFPADVYLKALVSEARGMASAAPRWFQLMVQSVLNSPMYVEPLRRAIQAAQVADAEFLKTYVEGLCRDVPKYRPLLAKLFHHRGRERQG